MKARAFLLILTSAALLVAAGCGDNTVTTPPPAVTTQTEPAKAGEEAGTSAPGASTLGIQENPNGSNPGLGGGAR